MRTMNKEKASEAAISVTDYQNDINDIKSDLKLLKFGIALIIAAELLPVLKTFFV